MLNWLRRKFQPKELEGEFPSLVFLLDSSPVLTADDAVQLCQSAWGGASSVKLVAIVSEGHYALEADPLFFAFHSVAACYQAKPPALSQVEQQCWDRHTAWMSIDLVKHTSVLRKSGSYAAAYKILFC